MVLQPLNRLAAGAATAVAENLRGLRQDLASEQRFDGTDEAVGTLASSIVWTGSDGDITVHGGPAAQAVVGRAISEVNLLHITARRKIVQTFDDLHHAGAALTNPTAIVEIVEPFVGIEPGIERGATQVGPFDATHLLAFLFVSDGGHGTLWISGAHQPTSNWPLQRGSAKDHRPAAMQDSSKGDTASTSRQPPMVMTRPSKLL